MYEVAEDIFFDDIVIHDASMGFLGSNEDSNISRGFVFKETKFSDSSFFPLISKTIDFASKFRELFFLFLSCDFGHLGKVY